MTSIVPLVLASLRKGTSVQTFLRELSDHNVQPLLIARPVEWMILPTNADYLRSYDWDILLILGSQSKLPPSVGKLADATYTLPVQQADTAIRDFGERNKKDLSESSEPSPLQHIGKKPLRSLSSQRLELSPSLLALAHSDLCPKGPVSMLNFVSFQPWPEAAENYKKYVDANQAGPQKRVGSRVKFIGMVDHGLENIGRGEWDEVLIAQYPSLKHFCDMACDPDYQAGNYKWRLPALRDTCILMTTEVDLDWTIIGSKKVKPEAGPGGVQIEPGA